MPCYRRRCGDDADDDDGDADDGDADGDCNGDDCDTVYGDADGDADTDVDTLLSEEEEKRGKEEGEKIWKMWRGAAGRRRFR